MIGPARPVTTTQEAIDNAGFQVGQFEESIQGMRNCTMLGDGSKCLVCMMDYEQGENMRALGCHHGFHLECIDKVKGLFICFNICTTFINIVLIPFFKNFPPKLIVVNDWSKPLSCL